MKYALITDYWCYSDTGYDITIVDKKTLDSFQKEHDFVKKYNQYIDIDYMNTYASYEYDFNHLHRIIKIDDSEELDFASTSSFHKSEDPINNTIFYEAIIKYCTENNIIINKN